VITRVPESALRGQRWDPDYWDPRHEALLRELREGPFPLVPLGEAEPFVTYGAIVVGRKRPELDEGIRYVDTPHMRPTGLEFPERGGHIPFGSPWDLPRARLRRGDVLLARSGVGSVGRAEVWDSDEPATVGCYVDIIRQDRFNPFYLTVFLKSRFGQGQIERYKCGVGTVNLNFGEIRSILVPEPPEEIQRRVETAYRFVMLAHRRALALKAQPPVATEGEERPETYETAIESARDLLARQLRMLETMLTTEDVGYWEPPEEDAAGQG
jgi:DNA-directed RNA polymerase subunit K/omega